MRRFILILLVIQGFSFSILANVITHEINYSNIRVRLFKELEQFPHIQNAQAKVIAHRVWAIDGTHLTFQDKKLSSKNFILKKENGRFDLIGVFDFNKYLAGVVSKEMPLRWPLEALKAQAVIARSYALSRMSERKNKIFHLDTDQMDQVFAVTTSEKANLAVALTDQIVLKNHAGKVLKAFYHADCGGQTIPASKVWSDALDTGTAIDPWCAARRSNEWSFEIPKAELEQRLNEGATEPTQTEASLQVAEKYQGRIQTLKWAESFFPVQKLRQIFGFSNLRNSPQSVSESETSWVFKGKGFGHGVGLCQWGSLAQARLGRSYTQILEHYYPEAHLSNTTLKLSQNFLSDLVFN